MKNLFLAVCIVLLFASGSFAQQFLCVDAQSGVDTYILEIDGAAPIVDLPYNEYTFGADTMHCFYDVGQMSMGEHTFRAKAVDESGWEADWSVPFFARKPSASANMKIKKTQ